MLQEEENHMKVQPIYPAMYSLMRFKNSDNQTNKSDVTSESEVTFKQIIEQISQHSKRMLPTPENISFCGPPPLYGYAPSTNGEQNTEGKLNFII